ncbi:MAG: AEC family transporter, partial [Oscillospiraceae bacterium]|nr:AEC family transporter [Oscillospiraceae bacterium]
CTLVSNGGFLGNPIAEGVYGSLGLLYASLFLIPTRIVMWSVGTSYFVAGSADPKKVLKNIVTHPCLVAVYLGLFLMITGIPLPGVVESTVRSIGGCNTAMTMLIVGTVMAEVPLHTIFTRTTMLYSGLRLVLIPLAALGMCALAGLSGPAAGVCVLLAGMPAAATTALFAARYDSDAPFAARCVVLSTLLSMLTVPVWCWVVG